MNPELPNNPREELELRITALLLGELPADEAAVVREAIAKDAELTKLHDDLKQTIVLVREASCMKESAAPQAEPLKLSEQRRQKLLTAFKIPPLKEKDRKPKPLFRMTLIEALVVVAIAGILAAMLLPSLSKARSTSQRAIVINNLRQIDGAKQQWAIENNKSADAEPTFDDIKPYLGRGQMPSVAGEKYVLGKVGEPVAAETTLADAKQAFGRLPEIKRMSSDQVNRVRVDSRGNVTGREVYYDQVASTTTASKPAAAALSRIGGVTYSVNESIAPSPAAKPATTIELPALAGVDGEKSSEDSKLSGLRFRTWGEKSDRYPAREADGDVAAVAAFRSIPKVQTAGGQGGDGPRGGISSQTDLGQNVFNFNPSTGTPIPESGLDESIFLSATPPPASLPEIADSFNAESPVNGLIDPATGLPVTKGKDANVYDVNAVGYAVAPIVVPPSAPAAANVPTRSLRGSSKVPGDKLGVVVDSPGTAGRTDEHFYADAATTSAGTSDKPNANAQDAKLRERYGLGRGVAGDESRANLPEQQSTTDAKTRAYLDQKQKVEVLRKQVASGFETAGNSGNLPNESDLYRTYEKQALEYRARYGALTNQLRKSDGLNSSTKELETQIKIAKTELDSVNQLLDDSKSADNARSEETRPYFEAKKKLEELGRALAESQSDPAPLRKPATNAAIPQPEIQTSENNFSTFSLNVSDVSFKLAAASLEKGQMPDAASVRSEEFINAFDYRDPEPQGSAPIAFAWERARYPFAHNRDLLRFSLKTAAAGRQAGRPLNIVLLLDNSGSMERADRVRIIREALRVLASQLQSQDKLSVITFARTARLVADGISGDKAAEVAVQVSDLTPEGGTNLEDAMNLAYQTAARHYSASGINRVVLLTDGAANLGDVEPASLKQKVEAQRKQGIALDCFGIGWEGFNDDLLEVLSRNGDGRYGFINSPEEAATDFVGQLAGALQVAASDVKVQVEFNPKRVTSYRQIGYAKHQLTKEQFRDNTVDAAEIAAQEAGNALYTVEANPAGAGPLATVRVRYKVPGTSDYREQSWDVPLTGNALSLEQSSPAMRLAASASAFSEWLVASPFAVEVKPDALLGYLRGVPEVYGADARPKKLEWMIRQAKSVAGQ